ncbi:MAG: phosphatidate cytidylyltransferase [Verrucomicrobiaceae bacterium]|nr:phosphatidate cytidylyltransferase [Verrucomicrobiaceae bacterium]
MSESAAAAPPTTPSRRRVFASRLFSTLLLWSLLTVAFLQWQNTWLIIAITGFFGVAGAVEYYRLLRNDPQARSFNALGFVICITYWASVIWYTVTRHNVPPMWLDLYTVIFFGFIARLMYFQSEGQGITGIFLVLFLVMVTKFSDMGAYVVGVLFGKHKMIPHISPAKSWEGFVGAFIGSFSAAAILLALMPEKLAPITWMHGMILAPVLCATAVTGDLAESVLKRCVAIKDSGHALPGIGGILDLTDSLLFTAPVFYFYLSAIAR